MGTVKILTKDSSDLGVKLPSIQHLARQVFEPDILEADYITQPTLTPQLQLDTWHLRLSEEHAAVFYITGDALPETSLTTPTPDVSPADTPIAIFLAHPRALSAPSSSTPSVTLATPVQSSYHIFLAAIHPSARGRGLFQILLEATKQHATEAGFRILTISTIPDRFPRMWSLLSRDGSGWEVVEWRDVEGSEGAKRKVVMKMPI